MEDLIKLDPRIRDWVLIPIFVVMLLQGVLRHYLTVLLQSDPVLKFKQLRHTQLMRRALRLRTNYAFVSYSAFAARKHYLTTSTSALAPAVDESDDEEEEDNDSSSKSGKSKKAVQSSTPTDVTQLDGGPVASTYPSGDDDDDSGGSPLDPMNMMDGVKQNMLMIVPNMLQMGWISYFFAGFVLVKLPFPLAERFKPMLQRGIALRSLDAAYVSSLSWYFLTMFGLRGVYALLLGSDANTGGEDQFVQQMAGGGASMVAGAPNHAALYAAEKTEIEIVQHEGIVAHAQYRLLGLAPPAAKR